MKYLLIISILYVHSFSCGWVNGTTLDGKWRQQSGFHMELEIKNLKDHMRYSPRERLDYFLEYSTREENENKLTKAVYLMLDGKYQDSIDKLLIEEKREGDRYEVAANLGTAYELLGDNINAIKWIKEGIKRNPSSHYGTEWLHIKILETKLILEKEPDYLKSNHVLNMFELESRYFEFNQALLHQLRERMLFVKPKNPIVADLLYSYALANAYNNGLLEYSMEALELSELYGYYNPSELSQKREEYQDIIDHVELIETLKIIGYIAIFIIFLFIAYKKKWFFLTKKAQKEHIKDSEPDQPQKNSIAPKKSKAILLGRILLFTTPLLAFLFAKLYEDVAFLILIWAVGWIASYIFIRDGKAYEAKINKKDDES